MTVEGRGGPIYSVLSADTKPTPIEPTALLVETDTGDFYVWDGAAWILIGGGASPTFLGLTDTPGSYVGQGLEYPRVNVGENALEFHDLLNVANTWAALQTFSAGIQLGAGQAIKDSGGTDRIVLATASPTTTLIGPAAGTNLRLSGGSAGLQIVNIADAAAAFGIQLVISATLAANRTTRVAIQPSGLVDLAGFNLASLYGINFSNSVSDTVGGGLLTELAPIRAVIGYGAGIAVTDAHTILAASPVLIGAPTVGTQRGITIRNQGDDTFTATYTTVVGLDIEAQSDWAAAVRSIRVLGSAVSIHQPALLLGANAAPATSAILELQSTIGALLLSRMTTAQRDLLTAVAGMVLYNSTLGEFQGYDGAWRDVIIAGYTAGGELAGTYPNPTVAGTHSGSAHHAQTHTLLSHSTRPHSDLTAIGAFDHMDYTEAFTVLTNPTATGTWEVESAAPAPANSVAEILLRNSNINNEEQVGARTVGSGLARIVDLHEAEANGESVVTMFVKVDGSQDIELYREGSGTASFVLVGYWS